MYRDFFTNKWCLGCIGLLLVVCIGCYLWYQHVTAPYRQQAIELDETLNRSEMSQNKQESVPITEPTDTITSETLHERKNNETQQTEVDPDILSEKKPIVTLNAPLETDTTDNSEEVAVSQYGFGPYPKIPQGMSFIPWERIGSADHELMQRVCIKLWEEGIHSDGAVMENGLVYPTVLGRLYIKDGHTLSHPDDNFELIRGRLPDLSNFDVYSYDEGIEPYSYLNIER